VSRSTKYRVYARILCNVCHSSSERGGGYTERGENKTARKSVETSSMVDRNTTEEEMKK